MSNSLRQAEVDNTALSLHRFMYQVRTPRLDLPLYTAPLTSPDLSFVAHLAILGGCTLSSADLLCLADMPNLGVLELMRPTLGNYAFPQVTDRLIRGWTEAPAPFPQLRVLRIWGTAVSPESLPWAARLPSLYIYDIAGSNDIWDYEEDVPSGDAVWTNASSKADQWRDESSCLCYVAVKDTVPTPEGATEEIPVRRVEYGSAELLAVCLEMDDFWDMYDEESWGFWAYSAVGQFTGDADLPRSSLTWQTVVKADGLEYVLPTVPMATLALGCYNRRNDPAVERRRTFVRTGTAEPPKPTRQPSPEKERQTKPSKRRRMDDMLSGLMG